MVDRNTSLFGNPAGVDGGNLGLVVVRLQNSCHVWLCVTLRYKSGFHYSVTLRHNKKQSNVEAMSMVVRNLEQSGALMPK